MMLNRRSLLRGMLAGSVVSIGLPPLEYFMNTNGTAYANGNGFPRRFGLFFWGNGNLPAQWTPMVAGPDWEMTAQLTPLLPHRDVLTVISGMSLKVPNRLPHESGAAGILTGSDAIGAEGSHTFNETIDQTIAMEIGNTTRFRSIEYGAEPENGLSHTGPHSNNPAEDDPFALFERLFGAGFREPGSTGEVDPKLALRRSVLDAVSLDVERVRKKIGAQDKIRLEGYLDGIRDIETRLVLLAEDPPELAACAVPEAPTGNFDPIEGRPQLLLKNQVMSELVAMAVACDQTRVVSNWFTSPVNNVLFEGASNGHHNLTHDEPGDQPECNMITTACIQAYSDMVTAFRNIEEGDGTLLDNMALMATSDTSFARTHSLDDYPILYAGSACGQLQTGTHVAAIPGENASRFLLSLIRSMGINRADYGSDDAYADTGFSDIEVI